ncbi:MAG: hypothetical protein ACR2FJ_02340 [Qipengyuania sp.]
MSTQITVLAAEFAALPGVAETAGVVREPSNLAVLMIGLAGLALGRFVSIGRRSASRD